MAADSVNFIDEQNTGSVLFCLVKEVTHPGSTDTHKHLNKVRAAYGKEGHPGLTGDCPCKEGFSGPRGSNEKHTFRYFPSELLKFRGILQKINDLLHLSLGLIYSRNV